MSAPTVFSAIGGLAEVPAPPRLRHVMYGFPETEIPPGEGCTSEIVVKDLFRAERLLMVGQMDEIRGTFWIKRSRLPLLDRRNVVVAYSKVVPRRYGKKKQIGFAKGKTVVEYADATLRFKREYQPSSVVYSPTDPLSYIRLRNLYIGKMRQVGVDCGLPAVMFGANVGSRGMYLPMDTAAPNGVITIVLHNDGDIPVRVLGSIAGYEREASR